MEHARRSRASGPGPDSPPTSPRGDGAARHGAARRRSRSSGSSRSPTISPPASPGAGRAAHRSRAAGFPTQGADRRFSMASESPSPPADRHSRASRNRRGSRLSYATMAESWVDARDSRLIFDHTGGLASLGLEHLDLKNLPGGVKSSPSEKSDSDPDDRRIGAILWARGIQARRRSKILLQRFVDSWPMQILFGVVAVMNGASYWIPTGEHVPSEQVYFAACTLLLLFLITMCELLIRVAAQGGPLHQGSSWLRFFSLSLEVLVICVFLYWLWVCVVDPFRRTRQGGTMSRDGFRANLFSVNVVAWVRFQRFWGICFNITVEEEEKRRRARRGRDRYLWKQEHEEKIALRNKERLARMEAFLDSVIVQLLIALWIIGQAFLVTLSRTVRALEMFYGTTKFTGYALAALYAFEFMIRCTVQGGFEQFVSPTVHKVEIVTAMSGLYFLIQTNWNHDALLKSGEKLSAQAICAGLLLLVHRGIRAFEILHDLSAADTATENFTDAIMRNRFMAFAGDLLRVAPENVFVRFQMPSDLTVRLHKAELNGEVLQSLHLPIALRGGLVEELHLSMKFSWKGTSEASLKVENAVLLLAPGDGLAEAEDSNRPSCYWTPDIVREAKSNLVEIICERLTPSPESDKGIDEAQGASRIGGLLSASNYFANIRKRFASGILDSMLKNLTVDIKNVRVQMDDSHGALGLHHLTLGAKVGSIKLERRQGTGSMHRLGIFVQTQPTEKAEFEFSEFSSFESMAEALANRLRQHTDIDLIRSHTSSTYSRRRRRSAIWFSKPSSKRTSAASSTRRSLRSSLGLVFDDNPSLRSHIPPLYSLIDRPKLALAELVRQNHLERWRVWALEGLEKRMPSTDKQRHARRQRFPERHLVFSLLRVELECGAEAVHAGGLTPRGSDSDPASTRAETPTQKSQRIPRSDTFFSRGKARAGEALMPKKWKWSVNVPDPVRLNVTEDQVHAVRKVISSVRSWLIHDSAMKWWPGLRLCDLQDYPRRGLVRYTVVRMWWIYAVHRVLARRQKQAKSMMMDAMWQGMILSRYKELLRDMAHCRRPHGGSVPNASLKAFQPYKAESRQVKELQLLLPLEDIWMQRRQAISKAPPSASRRGSSRLLSASQVGSYQPLQSALRQSMQRLCRTTYGQEAAAGDLDPEVGRDLEDDPDPATSATRLSAPPRTLQRQSSSAFLGAVEQESNIFALSRFVGHWELNVPAVELLVLTGKRARTRLLHGKIHTGVCGDAHVLGGQEFVTPLSFAGASRQATGILEHSPSFGAGMEKEGRQRACLLALSVDGFVLTSPDKLSDFRNTPLPGEDIRDMLHGAPPEVVRVVQPVRLGTPASVGLEAARATGRRTSGSISFAVFASLNPGVGGECEVHLADLDVVASDRLLERMWTFAGFARLAGRYGEAGVPPTSSKFFRSRARGFDSTQSNFTTRSTTGGIFRHFTSFSTGISSVGVDVGRHAEFDDDDDDDDDLDDAEQGFAKVTRIYQEDLTVGQLRRNQMLYEHATKLAGLHGDIDVCYNVGAIHMVNVSQYSPASLCVFQVRMCPFTFRDREDKVACSAAKCGSEHSKVSLEFNGFAEAQCHAEEGRRPGAGSRTCPGCGNLWAHCCCDASLFDLSDRGVDRFGFLDLSGPPPREAGATLGLEARRPRGDGELGLGGPGDVPRRWGHERAETCAVKSPSCPGSCCRRRPAGFPCRLPSGGPSSRPGRPRCHGPRRARQARRPPRARGPNCSATLLQGALSARWLSDLGAGSHILSLGDLVLCLAAGSIRAHVPGRSSFDGTSWASCRREQWQGIGGMDVGLWRLKGIGLARRPQPQPAQARRQNRPGAFPRAGRVVLASVH
ncbi:unnamed protein product [Prorocentrum cordatum]|uniref:Uncharacterized protein n=1 Tax=Prorocentrum cordatum TaxID=2364126 RepID=A0ABN9PSA9_9DINO|nr:unnamed protein product [Polarella glacialis]